MRNNSLVFFKSIEMFLLGLEISEVFLHSALQQAHYYGLTYQLIRIKKQRFQVQLNYTIKFSVRFHDKKILLLLKYLSYY